jgi:hypothetical protein
MTGIRHTTDRAESPYWTSKQNGCPAGSTRTYWLTRVLRAVVQQPCPEILGTCTVPLQLRDCRPVAPRPDGSAGRTTVGRTQPIHDGHVRRWRCEVGRGNSSPWSPRSYSVRLSAAAYLLRSVIVNSRRTTGRSFFGLATISNPSSSDDVEIMITNRD